MMRRTDPGSVMLASSIRTLDDGRAPPAPAGRAGSSQPPSSPSPMVLSRPERRNAPISTSDPRTASGPARSVCAEDALARPRASSSVMPSASALVNTIAPDGSMRAPRAARRSARRRPSSAPPPMATSCASTESNVVMPDSTAPPASTIRSVSMVRPSGSFAESASEVNRSISTPPSPANASATRETTFVASASSASNAPPLPLARTVGPRPSTDRRAPGACEASIRSMSSGVSTASTSPTSTRTPRAPASASTPSAPTASPENVMNAAPSQSARVPEIRVPASASSGPSTAQRPPTVALNAPPSGAWTSRTGPAPWSLPRHDPPAPGSAGSPSSGTSFAPASASRIQSGASKPSRPRRLERPSPMETSARTSAPSGRNTSSSDEIRSRSMVTGRPRASEIDASSTSSTTSSPMLTCSGSMAGASGSRSATIDRGSTPCSFASLERKSSSTSRPESSSARSTRASTLDHSIGGSPPVAIRTPSSRSLDSNGSTRTRSTSRRMPCCAASRGMYHARPRGSAT